MWIGKGEREKEKKRKREKEKESIHQERRKCKCGQRPSLRAESEKKKKREKEKQVFSDSRHVQIAARKGESVWGRERTSIGATEKPMYDCVNIHTYKGSSKWEEPARIRVHKENRTFSVTFHSVFFFGPFFALLSPRDRVWIAQSKWPWASIMDKWPDLWPFTYSIIKKLTFVSQLFSLPYDETGIFDHGTSQFIDGPTFILRASFIRWKNLHFVRQRMQRMQLFTSPSIRWSSDAIYQQAKATAVPVFKF